MAARDGGDMRVGILFAALALMTFLASGMHAEARPVVDALEGRGPVSTATQTRRCSDDGAACIHLDSYVADVCRVIERAATQEGLNKNFLARLLWKESRFEPGAVSPAGAEGIAQFIPSTAAIVGLDDPFNPAKAILVSARYLRELEIEFGSLGLAAVAYNGGENRAAEFLRSGGTLPYETQDYVEAITGHNAWKWRDDPPKGDKLDMRLDGDTPFLPACIKLAGNRSLREFKTQSRPKIYPWGVIVASHPTRNGVQSKINRLNRRLNPILGGKRISYVRRRLNGNPRKVYTAQIGYNSRGSAQQMCGKLRRIGAPCIVLRN